MSPNQRLNEVKKVTKDFIAAVSAMRKLPDEFPMLIPLKVARELCDNYRPLMSEVSTHLSNRENEFVV